MLTKVVKMVDVSEAVTVEVSDEASLELGLTGLVALETVTEEVEAHDVREVVRVMTSVDETVMMAIEVQDGDDATGTTV